MAVMSADQITIIDVTDAYSVMLSMDAVSLTGGEDSLGTAQTVTIYVSALMGAMKVTPRIGTIECPANVEATVGSAIDSVVPITVLFNAAVKRSGKLSIPVTVNNEVTITKEFAYSISFKGEGGTPGKDGKDGKDGFSPVVTKSGDTVTITDADGHTVTVKDGADGHSIKGDDGEDAYVHIAWANSADGSTDFSTTDSTNKLYMGTYTDHTLADSTKPSDYAWVKIKGDPGVSITGVTNYYLATNASSGVTRSTSGWTTGIQAITESKQYLWNYEVTTGNDGSTISTTDPVIIGRYGKDGGAGSAGRGIAEITEYYCASASTTAPADSEFSTSVQTTTATKKYLWNYEKITYTSGNPETTAKRIIGTYGDKGEQGSKGAKGDPGAKGDKGDQGVSVTNVTSTNNTADGGTSVVTVTLSDGTTKTFNVKNGNKGNPGTNGASSQWYYGNKCTHTSGTAKPATGIASAIVGDMYLNTDTYSVYRCTTAGASGTAVWTYAGNLVEGVIDGVEIGGRNLLRNSSFANGFSEWDITNSNVTQVTEDDYECGRITLATGTTARRIRQDFLPKVKTDDQTQLYTLSIEIKLVNWVAGSSKPACTLYLDGHKGSTWIGATYIGDTGDFKEYNNKGWVKVKTVFKINQPRSELTDLYAYVFTRDGTGTLYFRNIKLEKGNKATDWSPAPEDVQAEIDAKKSVHTLTSSNTAGTTYAKLLAWSAEGHSDTWNISSATPTTNVRVGDTVRIAYPISDMNKENAYIIGTVTAVNSETQIKMISHGLDTTIIDGGNILTNSIGANQIAANSIGAKHLTISDSTNLATANELYEASLPSDLPADWAPSISGGYLVKKTATQGYLMVNHYTPNSFKNGDELYYEFYGKAATAGTVGFGAWCYNSSGSFLSNTSANINLTTTEALYSGTIKMSSTSWNTAAKYVLGFNDNRSTKSQIYIRKLIIRRKEDAIRYITDIDGTGIKVHAASNESSNYAQIDGNGMSVYKGGTKRAEFFDSVNLYASDGSTKIASFTGDGVSLHSTSLQNVGRFYVTSDTKDGKTRTFGTLSLGSSENPVIKGYNYTGDAEDISALIMDVNGTEWDSKFTASLDFTGMSFQQDNVGYWSAGLQSGGFYVSGPNGTFMGVDSSGNGTFAGGLSVNGTISCDYDQITLENTRMKRGSIFLYKIGRFVVYTATGDFVNLPAGGVTNWIPASKIPTRFKPITTFMSLGINNQNVTMYITVDNGIGFYNYGAAITQAMNGAFSGIYVSNI